MWKTTRTIVANSLLILSFCEATAQEHRHGKKPEPPKKQGAHQHTPSDVHDEHAMAMTSGPLGIPETRNASGTAWQPDSTPMHGVHFTRGSWSIMAHENFFAGYDYQGSDRGDSEWTAPNWGMLMEKRSVGRGELMFRQMLSLDPVTMGSNGYPLLLQTGESLRGLPLHDRQHPHDLFMEIAAVYTHPLSESMAFQLYLAPAGEPALGPVAFPHRLSAASDPLASLSHHWQDSSHISFGVLTAGLMTRKLKLESSWFNGREPDEHRYDFDLRRPDSYSGRLWFNPSEAWSLQVSYGYLASPEELQPDESLHRFTTSAAYNLPVGPSGVLATTAVMGRNHPSKGPETSSWLLEANYETNGRSVLFGRAEYVEKTGEDLVLSTAFEPEVFKIKSLVAGYVFRVTNTPTLVLGLGARASVSFIGSDLEPFYGTRNPSGYMVFLQIHPTAMKRHAMKM
ncbi:MAG TPA: hypothetical protein VGR67_09105 [Candidatus Polarisedimenticolia bacterium]|nr:hypothetical protein [Candidatus Polarisedimenticolia bacterium]